MDRRLDRRQFARAASSGLALFAIPGWFAACQRVETATTENVSEAGGRVQLLLHVEKDEGRREELGLLVGSFLAKGRIEQQAILATCEIRCATTDELAALGIELEGVRAVLLVPGEAPKAALVGLDDHGTSLHEDHAELAAQLSRALGVGTPAFETTCRLEQARVGELDPDSEPSFDLALERPCQALRAAYRDERRREAWLLQLSLALQERALKQAPQGSVWGTDSGCGVELELPAGRESGGGLCGMGSVPELQQRFLHFLTTDELRGR